MKKSIPVSDDLVAYFTDPCPVLSDNNSVLILDEIKQGYDYVVEYGMGASTLYCLPALEGLSTHFISVENNFDWFQICVQQVEWDTDFKRTEYSEKPWSLKQIDSFAKGKSKAADLPKGLERLPRWNDVLSLGPFYRFAPSAKSSLSGKLGPAYSALKPVLKLCASAHYAVNRNARPYSAHWSGQKEKATLTLRNEGPSVKDQYGEAPNYQDYIDAGLKDIKEQLEKGENVKALIIIDGGPRHKIVAEVLRLEDAHKHFKPTIILCDACRAFYSETLDKRPSGKFMAGSNKTLKGDAVTAYTPDDSELGTFWNGDSQSTEDLAAKEVWFYKT